MRLSDLYYLNRHDRRILLVLLTVAAIAFATIFFVGGQEEETAAPEDSEVEVSCDTDSMSASHTPNTRKNTPQYYAQPERIVERFAFDPNTADSTQLLRLGLQDWQVRNIYKYRAAGGIYRTKEDFAKLYGLTVKQYHELEPYIQISSDYLPASTLIKKEESTHRSDTLGYPVKIAEGETIDLNVGDTTVYRKVPGIGSYYAKEIVRHGKWIGGYVSVDQLDEIDGFPQTAKQYFIVDHPTPQRLNINRLSLKQLRNHPYINYYQAKAIVDYRRLHGDIKSLQDLRFSKDFTEGAIRRLEPYIEY